MGRLYIGTCSWKYPSWEGLVYSSSSPVDYLAEYALKFESVEVDQWFWSLGKQSAGLPKPHTVQEYNQATPPGFRFTIKCPNSITLTHHYAEKGGPLSRNPYYLDLGLFKSFIEILLPLVPKIGLLMFQFEYLNQTKMSSRSVFLNQLDGFLREIPSGLPYAVEIRNPSWMDGAWFSFLSEHKVAPVILQGYWMDDIAKTIERFENLMGDTVCIRLHGDDRNGIEKLAGEDWSRIVLPRDPELPRIAYSIKRLYEGGRLVYLNVNNHYEGSAPLTIEKILTLLG